MEQQMFDRKKLTLIIVGVLAAVLGLVFVYQFVTKGTLQLSTANLANVQIYNKTDDEAIKTIVIEENEMLRLPAGEYLVVSNTATGSSQHLVDIGRFFEKTSVVLPEVTQTGLQKVARNAASCAVPSKGTTYSYECGYGKILRRHTPVTKDELSSYVPLRTTPLVDAVAYKAGILALGIEGVIEGNTQVKLQYIVGGNVQRSTPLPGELQSTINQGTQYSLHVDGETFVVVLYDTDVRGIVSSNEALQDASTFRRELRAPGENVSFDIKDEVLLIVNGRRAVEAQDETERTPPGETYVTTYNLSSKQDKLNETIDGPVDQAWFCGNDKLCILQDGTVSVHTATEEIPQEFSIPLVERAVVSDGELYTTAGDESVLYKWDLIGKSATSVADLSYLQLEQLSDGGAQPLITATFRGADIPATHAFLADTPNKTYYDAAFAQLLDLPFISGLDFTGNDLHVRLLLDSARRAEGEGVDFDAAELSAKKTELTTVLQEAGLQPNNYRLFTSVTY